MVRAVEEQTQTDGGQSPRNKQVRQQSRCSIHSLTNLIGYPAVMSLKKEDSEGNDMVDAEQPQQLIDLLCKHNPDQTQNQQLIDALRKTVQGERFRKTDLFSKGCIIATALADFEIEDILYEEIGKILQKNDSETSVAPKKM